MAQAFRSQKPTNYRKHEVAQRWVSTKGSWKMTWGNFYPGWSPGKPARAWACSAAPRRRGPSPRGRFCPHCGIPIVATGSREPLAIRDPSVAALLLRSTHHHSGLRLFGDDVLSERGRARGWAEPAAACDSAGSATPPRAPAPPAPPGASFPGSRRAPPPLAVRVARAPLRLLLFFPLPSAARPSLPGSSGASGHAGSSLRASFPLRPDRVAETWCTRQQLWVSDPRLGEAAAAGSMPGSAPPPSLAGSALFT